MLQRDKSGPRIYRKWASDLAWEPGWAGALVGCGHSRRAGVKGYTGKAGRWAPWGKREEGLGPGSGQAEGTLGTAEQTQQA